MLINELAPPSPSLCLNVITSLAFKGALPSPANEFGTCVQNRVGHLDYTLPLPWDSPVTLQRQATRLKPHRATPTQASGITLIFTTSGEERRTLSHLSLQGIQGNHLFSTCPCIGSKQGPRQSPHPHKASSCQWYEPGTVCFRKVLKCCDPCVKWPTWVKFHRKKIQILKGEQGKKFVPL